MPIPAGLVDPDRLAELVASGDTVQDNGAETWSGEIVRHARDGLARVGLADLIVIRHAAVELLASAVARLASDDPADWPTWRVLTPRLSALLEATAAHLPPDDLTSLLDATARVINFHAWTGADPAGERLGRLALTHRSHLDPDQPAVLGVRLQLAHTAGQHGRWEQAETEYRKVLAASMRVLGADHPDTLDTRQNLAQAAGQLGRNKRDRRVR